MLAKSALSEVPDRVPLEGESVERVHSRVPLVTGGTYHGLYRLRGQPLTDLAVVSASDV